MARVKIEGIVDKLDREFRKALEETLNEHFENHDFEISEIFRTFKRKVARKCRTWEEVPDSCIEK